MNNVPLKIRTIANSLFFEEVKVHLDAGKEVAMRVVGNSMYPFLRQGDKVILKPINPMDLRCGRILLASIEKGHVLHRLVRKTKTEVWLAGDANLVQLERISREAVWAVVVTVYRGNKRKRVNTLPTLLMAWIWYQIRPLRRIWKAGLKIR